MLALAGASAYVWSWKIAIAVALVMTAVIASYRQNVHAYPSGGGDYEVATVNLGRDGGHDGRERAARRLRPHRRGQHLVRGAVRRGRDPGRSRGTRPRAAVDGRAVLMAMNLRGIRESGTFFAFPTYAFMIAILGMCAYGFLRLAAGDLPDVESAGLAITPDPGRRRRGLADDARPALPAGPGVLLGLRGADRGRGHLQRGAGVPAAQEQERRDDAAPARDDRHHDDGEHHRARQADGHRYVDPHHLDQLSRDGRALGRRLRPEPGDRPDRAGGVHRLLAGVLLRRHGHRDHPGARRQHGVQRLPGARLDPGQGRLRPAGPRVARRPARLQQRHRLPRGDGDRADPRVRRPGDPADPALHRRRLRLVQPQPAGDDPALDPAPGDRDRPGRAAPDAALAGHQRDRADVHRRRAGHRADHQVPRRRLDRHPGHGLLLPRHARHPAPLRQRGRGARGRRRRTR